ncbi:MAG TPA: hypothetical protein PLO89_07395, partial [Spirochaetota bacterium]|nr:hypothetical protein [Spirochaetota bacterium]
IDLKASDVILSKDEYKDIFKLIQNIRVSKSSKNRLFIGLINMSSYILIDKDYSPSFVFDVGFKSIFLNAASVFSGFIGKNEDFSLERIKNEINTVYKIIFYKNNLTLFLNFKNNLVFLSFKEGAIEDIYRANLENKTIYYDDDFFHIRSRVKKNSLAEIYFNTNEVISSVSKNFPDLNNITQKFFFENNTGISANISNENISLNTYTKISTEDPILKNFLDYKPLDMRVTKYLPSDTNIYADINFKSFEEFYKVFLYLQGGKFDETIEKVNSAARIFFGGDINELLFSWIGNEAGFFSSSVSNSPVIFFSIKDRGKMNRAFENIYKSNLIQHETNLVYEGVKLDKTKLPDFLLWIVDSFYKGFDTPYYVVKDDFIFFSMEPDPLSNLINKFDSSKTLVYDNMYKKITSDVEKKANVFIYFNLGISIPKFLNGKTIITDIIKIYEKGTFSINFNGDALRLDFSAVGINEKKTRLFPGYPKFVAEGMSTEVMCKNILGSSLPELLYVRKDNKLVVADINNFPIQGFPVHIEGGLVNLPIILEDKIVCFTQNNYLHKFDFYGLEESPYPVKIDFTPTFYPKRYKNKFILFNGDKKKVYFYNDDNTFSDFNFEFKSPLLSPPEILNNNLLFYPKSFSGTIFFTDENGFILSGWPKET